MTNEKPLSNNNILVTRLQLEGDLLVAQLKEYGAKVYHAPTIEIVEPESFTLLDQAIKRLLQYDWVIFTSRNAVDTFLARLKFLEKESSLLTKLKILAVGSSTAKALEKANLVVTLIPEKFHAEGALESLKNYYQDNQKLSKCRFLFPRALGGSDLLVVELKKIGAKVDLVVAYQTQTPVGAKEEILNILSSKKINLITFTSPSTINNLVELVSPISIVDLLKNISIACIGPVTTKAVEEVGLKINVCPNQSTALSLAEAIKNYLTSLSH